MKAEDIKAFEELSIRSIYRYGTMASAITGIFICALGSLSKVMSGVKIGKLDAIEFAVISVAFLTTGYTMPYAILTILNLLGH
jgi:hypothetical protein